MRSPHDIYGEYRAACRRYKKNPCERNYSNLVKKHAMLLEHGGIEPNPNLWWSLPTPENNWVKGNK